MSIDIAVEYRGTTLRIGETDRPYFEAAAQGHLILQRCLSCSVVRYPPSPRCRACGSTEVRWTEVTGEGQVSSCVVVEHSVRHTFPAPYAVGLVELDELAEIVPLADSVRILSTILESDGMTPVKEPVPDGTAVVVCYRPLEAGLALPEFKLRSPGSP